MFMKKFISYIAAYIAGTSFIVLHAASVQASQFCFASAKTYYEQVYCELEAKGKTKDLPSFDQFKHNNEIVQASLLKLPAERNRIALPPPKKAASSVDDVPAPTIEKKALAKKESGAKAAPAQQENIQEDYNIPRKFDRAGSVVGDPRCQLHTAEIQCTTKRYKLIGNRTNSRLDEGALLDSNKMLLPLYQSGQSLSAYVTAAYRQYIEKMCAIGLGGVTMTYTRFAYLYEDLQSKNVNFVQRFELMYSFLKKDKAAMWISEKIPVNAQLAMQYCELMTEKLYICAAQGQNYIFELDNNP